MPQVQADPASRKPDLFPEAIDALRELIRRGLKIAVISAGRLERIKQILEEKNAADLFDYIVGAAHNKTEAIKQFAREHNFDPRKILMFGDLPSDLRDAKAAGVRTAAIARFETAEDRLGAYDPDFLFKGLGPEILKPKPFQDQSE
jgi:phosphoglycolate phosphatase-like HAD superfamily hydrolase